jgi:hypothetical protein
MTALIVCAVLWFGVGAIAAIDLRRRGEAGWRAVCVLLGGMAGAIYWASVRARSEAERRDSRNRK